MSKRWHHFVLLNLDCGLLKIPTEVHRSHICQTQGPGFKCGPPRPFMHPKSLFQKSEKVCDDAFLY